MTVVSLGVWEGLLFVIVAHPGLLSYLYFTKYNIMTVWSTVQSISVLEPGHEIMVLIVLRKDILQIHISSDLAG